uniref:Uncharacterized protein n=1 Tax=Arundo donax TaxID=35708 RepID=A0A0A8Y4L0_ARUDO
MISFLVGYMGAV